MENIITYENLKNKYTQEVLNLCSINERIDSEYPLIQDFRISYANIFKELTELRDKAWRSEAWRNYAIAITELENSLIRAIKWVYSI